MLYIQNFKKHIPDMAKGYTFKKTKTLFDEDAIMILRNRDKQHIVSLTEVHIKHMQKNNYDPNNDEHIMQYLKDYKYL